MDMIEGLGTTIGLAGPNTKIIPGHGATVDRAAVIAHRDMILVLRDRVAQMIKQGKTRQRSSPQNRLPTTTPRSIRPARPASDSSTSCTRSSAGSEVMLSQEENERLTRVSPARPWANSFAGIGCRSAR